MNYPGVYLGAESELAKIHAGKGKNIDGHAPGSDGAATSTPTCSPASGPTMNPLSWRKRRRNSGSACTSSSAKAAPNATSPRSCRSSMRTTLPNCSFATDDKLAGDLVAEGHIDHSVRKAIQMGLPPMTALQIATINTARHYRLRNFGAIAPRYWADFIVFDDLQNFVVRQT